jgi:hypothetical protein
MMTSPSPNSPLGSPLFLLWRNKSLTSSPTSSLSSSISSTWSTSSGSAASSTQSSLSCAFPSWPLRQSLSPPLMAQKCCDNTNWDVPTSYITDEDLYPEDLDGEDVPYFEEAPAPPRDPVLEVAPLPPLYASARPKKQQRRRSSKKGIKFARPMTPIAESPSCS